MGAPYTEKVTKYYVNENVYLNSLQAVRAISEAVKELTEAEYDSFVECVFENDGDYFEAVKDLNSNHGRNVIDFEVTTSVRKFT